MKRLNRVSVRRVLAARAGDVDGGEGHGDHRREPDKTLFSGLKKSVLHRDLVHLDL
jgi:hypothetical protein